MRRSLALIACVLTVLASGPAFGEKKFYPDDPLWVEPRIAAKKPAEVKRSEVIDFMQSSSGSEPGGRIPRAANANTVGGVPDSAWFTNRIGKVPMSLEALNRGPNRSGGPDVTGPLLIKAPKVEGVTAGFQMKDKRGDSYFVKLDPLNYPQLTTSAEAISTRFFHAFGYNVPENYLIFVKREQLRVDPEAKKKGKPFSEEDLDRLLKKAPRRPDGSYQMLASKKIKGAPVGTFEFEGTRPDDPNDVFPHEHRRELRGLRLFCAWLNHVDVDTINTLDVFEGEESNGHIKHYLIDFGTTLGSGAFEPQRPRVGHEYPLEVKQIAKSIFSFGLWERPWQKIDYPEFPQVGNFEASHFVADRWKPDYPNPAFSRMTLADAYWAARIIAQFSDEAVRAIVRTGKIEDPQAEEYLVQTLLERRDRILSHYLSNTNPLDGFEIRTGQTGARLNFRNLGVEKSLGTSERYEYVWYSLDNDSGLLTSLGSPRFTVEQAIPLPQDEQSPYLMVGIRTLSSDRPNWAREVRVYLVASKGAWRIVGVEREEEGASGTGRQLLAGDGTPSTTKTGE